tara:strand:+ start:2423 stop:3952 length:1530 start_codon:yes stop_codon:yes gene_type:complete
MNIPIFQSEIDAGLSDLIRSNASIAYSALAAPHKPSEVEEEKEKLFVFNTKALSNPEQIDLYYLNSVLVSVGWNKNDDVFDPKEVWAAKDTPEDKQFNFMHDENDIIGHITGNCVLNSNGKVIADDQDMPDLFDIVTSAVIYKSWSDPEKRSRIDQVIAEIEDGKWFVSMECLFKGFDYAVVSPDGTHNIVTRNETSAFLTKHLRSYGGQGEYEGHKVGRLLRNISFSGKGLVNNPANPNSVILKENDPFKSTQACVIEETTLRETNKMSNDTVMQEQLDTLKADLAEAKKREENLEARLKELDEKAFTEKVEALEAEIQTKDETIASMSEVAASFDAEKTELTETLTKAQEAFDALQSEVDAIKAEAHKAARLAALVQAGLDEEAAAEKLEKFADASDEIFAEIVELLSAADKAGYPPNCKDGFVAKDGKCVPEEADAEVEESADADEDIASDEAAEEADADVLDEVEEEAEASLADAGETDSVKSARTIASEWLKSSILKTTADSKE